MWWSEIFTFLKENGFDFGVTFPSSKIKNLLEMIEDDEELFTVPARAELSEAFERGLERGELSFIHATIVSDDAKLSVIPIDPITIKNRFMNSIDP